MTKRSALYNSKDEVHREMEDDTKYRKDYEKNIKKMVETPDWQQQSDAEQKFPSASVNIHTKASDITKDVKASVEPEVIKLKDGRKKKNNK